MKKSIYLFLVAIIAAIPACAKSDWRGTVGLPAGCDNPVFTMPERMNPEGRVHGAGINMNDGEAYTSNFVNFSSEWHYAPKLNLCAQEKEQLPQVMGLYLRQEEINNIEPLKFSVKAVNECYAVVVYRAFRNYRYSNDEHENLEQFIAVYDSSGKLTDVMMMGYVDDIRDVLLVEPHKEYEVPYNMGDHNLNFDKDNSNHFTINRYWYLKNSGQGIPKKVEMKRYYTITPAGKIHLDKVTNNSENYTTSKANEAGAPIEMVANPQAVNLMELMLTPMSDQAGTFAKLEKVCASLIDDTTVGNKVTHLGMMIYNRNPRAFLSYVYKNRTKTSLVKLLKRAKAYNGPGLHYDDNLNATISKSCSTAAMSKWFKIKLK